MTCSSGHCTSRDLQCKTLMGSYTQNNDTYACDSSNCQLSCASPEFGPQVCYGMQQNFLDGTTCGGGGKCQNVGLPPFEGPPPFTSAEQRTGRMQRLFSRPRDWIMDQSTQGTCDWHRLCSCCVTAHLIRLLCLWFLPTKKSSISTGPEKEGYVTSLADGGTTTTTELEPTTTSHGNGSGRWWESQSISRAR